MDELSYRNVEPRDFGAMHDIVSHRSVVRQLGSWPWPADPAFTKRRAQTYKGDGFIWAICREDRLIGTVAVTGRDLGYYLHPNEQGQGIMTRAIDAALAHAFQTLNRQVINASAWFDNPASHALVRKAGFTHWQTHYEHSIARGYPMLVYQHRLSRNTWQALRGRAQ